MSIDRDGRGDSRFRALECPAMLVEGCAFERDGCLLVRSALLDSVVMMRRCRRSSGSTLALKRSHSSYHT